jgi:Butirosin biosynthesis protein H, N-terminal/Domain of unknown function (DUF4872)
MTRDKQLKQRIRARMAKTGERYTTARLHLLDDPGRSSPAQHVTDLGYALRGGVAADSSAITNALANIGVRRSDGSLISEPLIFAVSGGIGALYILWEFARHNAPVLTLGFSSRPQYSREWATATLDRLPVPYEIHTTSGVKGAGQRLSEELDAGRPVIVLPDRYLLGYWHLPPDLEARGGHFLVAYGQSDDRVHLDDRNLAPLTIARGDFDRARQRVVSYKNMLLSIRPAQLVLSDDALAIAILEGLRDGTERLAGTSESFALPAWRSWARRMTDERNAKGWPRVFAGGRGLVGALLSVWEGVEPVGMTGGNLRGLFAESLTESAELLNRPQLGELAHEWRQIAQRWHDLAETALPADRPQFGRMRELTAAIQERIIAEGDGGADAAAAAADELWALRAEADAGSPFDSEATRSLFEAMANQLTALYDAETAAVRRLREALR